MSFPALKARQSEAWGSAPWEPMAARLAAIHDHLVARLAPARGERWLDVGTGTGAVALRAARAGARVTGVGLAPVMIDTPRRLAGEQSVGVRFKVGDAERLPYEDAGFDVVASALGVFLAPTTPRLAASLRAFAARAVVSAWSPGGPIRRPSACVRSFWPAREPGAGDRRDWGREEYVAELLGREFELEFEEGELRLKAGSGEEMWHLFTSHDGAAEAWTRSARGEPRSTAAPTSPTTSATVRTDASACRAATWSPSAAAGEAPARAWRSPRTGPRARTS